MSESLKVCTFFTFEENDSCMNFCPIKFYLCDTRVIAGDSENRHSWGDLTCLEEVDVI